MWQTPKVHSQIGGLKSMPGKMCLHQPIETDGSAHVGFPEGNYLHPAKLCPPYQGSVGRVLAGNGAGSPVEGGFDSSEQPLEPVQ